MERRYSVAVTALFCAFLGVFFLLNLLLPDRDFSPMENRALERRPTLSPRDFGLRGDFFSGRFMERVERYVNDQFAGREGFILLKAQSERAMGKQENNGVYFAAQDTLIARPGPYDSQRVQENLKLVSDFAARLSVPVYVSLIPGKASVWADRLPAGAPAADEREILELARQSGARWIEVADALFARKEQAIYYRTDHHWTSLGAWCAYRALAEGMGLAPTPLEGYVRRTVSQSFYGTDFSASGAGWVPPDAIDLFVPEEKVSSVTSWFGAGGEAGRLYAWDRLEEKDGYSFFLGGSQKLCVIRTQNKEGKKLLVIRDSYADSLAPFLTEHFSEIHLFDPRYNKASISAYAADIGADAVLILYSVANFTSDPNFFLLSR